MVSTVYGVSGLSKDGTDDTGNSIAYSGEHALVTLTALNSFEPDSFSVGQVLCRGGEVSQNILVVISSYEVFAAYNCTYFITGEFGKRRYIFLSYSLSSLGF